MVRHLAFLLFFLHGLNAQPCLSLSTVSVSPGSRASLDLSLNSPEMPASLQWVFQFPDSINSFTVEDGPATTAARKTILCAGDAAAYTCLVTGGNGNTISNGVVARVSVSLSPNAVNAIISIRNTMGVTAGGHFMPIFAADGTITNALVSPDRRLRPPLVRVSGRCLQQEKEEK
jgi:hypothetical protein